VSQIDGHGLDRQLESVRRWTKENGYEVVKVFKDVASGITDESERPSFREMIGDILSDGVRTIVVESLDRLAREYRIQETLLVYLASKGISLISARTGENVTEAIEGDPMRKALVQIQGIFSELEKSELVLRLRKAREKARKKRGKCEGRKAYGEESKEEQAIIKRIKLMRRRRRGGHRGLTYEEISRRLNEEGIGTATGREWTAQTVHHIATTR
jgi:DNA invertase Pin-like site-specific DNA recombinase